MKKNILIIEDDSSFAQGLQIILQDEGYNVSILEDDRSLGRNLNRDIPDLVLVDYRLPGKDGIFITRKLKTKKTTKKIPVIMMSASQNMNELARQAGAYAFLSKPFEIVELLDIIKRGLNN